MAIEVDHKGKGTKGREFEEAEAVVSIDEVEVVVENGTIFDREALCGSILEGGSLFQGGEDVDKTGVVPALEKYMVDTLIKGEALS